MDTVKQAYVRELTRAMDDQGVSRAELARRMGTSRSTVSRVLDPAEMGVTLATLERATRALSRSTKVSLAPDRPSERLVFVRDRIRSILEDAGYEDVHVFGSVARGEDVPTSDLDLVATFPVGVTLMSLGGISEELSEVIGCRVQLVDGASIRPGRMLDSVEEDKIAL